MGVPIPGGSFWLEDADGAEIKAPDATGELVYRGDNVAMGYAQCAEDLSKGDEWGGLLRTGDMAYRDRDGFYYIVGRKKRFVNDLTGKSSKNLSGVILIVIRQEVSARHNIKRTAPVRSLDVPEPFWFAFSA